MSEEEEPAALLGEVLLGEALELEPLEDDLSDDLSLEELGVDEESEAEPALGVLLGELDIEPEPDEDEPDGVDDDEPDDSGLVDLLEPEAPVVELAPRSQP